MRKTAGRGARMAMIGLAFWVAAPATAQEASTATADGFRLVYGPTYARPFLDDTAREPFVALGDDFRRGPGIRVGAGWQVGAVEVVATAEYAGLDVGDPFERDGIPQGRHSSILRSYTLTGWWSPSMLGMAGWRGRVGGGYVAGGSDNVSIAPSQLTGELLDLARTVEPGDESNPTGVSGSGFRAGVGAERDFTPTLAVQVHLEVDRMSYDEFIYARERFERDMGSSWIPRLAAVLRWAP